LKVRIYISFLFFFGLMITAYEVQPNEEKPAHEQQIENLD